MKKSSYLISKAFRIFLTATLLTSVSTQIALLTDGIIVSNFIAPQALSALNMAMPLTFLLEGFIPLLCMGASIIAAKKIGAQQYAEANRVFSVALTSGVIFFVIFSVLLMFFNRELSSFLCPDSSIHSYLQSYLSVFIPGMTINMVASCLQFFVNVDGKPQLVTKSVITYALTNILLDLFFIVVVGWGMQGAALATILSQIVSIIMLASHFKNKAGTLHFVNPFRGFMRVLNENVKQGTPMLISGLSISLIFLLINSIVLNTLGADGIFILSICMQIIVLLTFAVQGAGDSVLSIGGILIGENDRLGLRALVRNAFTFMNVGVLLFSALVFLFPASVIRLFGAESSVLIEESIIPVRIFIGGLVFFANFSMLDFLYQLLGRLRLSAVFSLLQMLTLLFFMWMCSLIIPRMLWVAFPLAFTSLFIIQLVYAYVASRKHPGMNRITLIPAVETNVVFDMSIGYSQPDMEQAMIEIDKFLKSQQVKEIISNKVMLCCEELMLNLISYGKRKGDKRSFDIHITHTKESIRVSIKDDGKPFNPTLKYQEKIQCELTDEDVKNLGLTIVNGTCKDLNYKFMYGQNMVYMNFPVTLSPP